jgi:Zn-dependent peptidase ImmA (M78 family)
MVQKSRNPVFLVNHKRLKYLLDLFNLSNTKFLNILHESRKRQLLDEDQLNKAIKQTTKMPLNTIKAIDKIFNRGLNWYITRRDLPERKSTSIFFRKNKFNSQLNLQSIKIASKFEEKKFEIQNLCSNINFIPRRKIKEFSIRDDPKLVAEEMKSEFEKIQTRLIKNKVLKKPTTIRNNLKNLMAIIEDYNIFVFEFIETWNQKEFVNFDGFFLEPNIIAIKKQDYPKREIFTLLHEFAHYLLNSEEIDEITENQDNTLNKKERWCYDFAYFFLAGKNNDKINYLGFANKENEFHKSTILDISENSLISTASLYTRLKILNKITDKDYKKIMEEINKNSNERRLREKKENKNQRQKLKELGKSNGFAIKPIQSNLFKEIVKLNYFQGTINQNSLCNYLKIKPDKIAKEIY